MNNRRIKITEKGFVYGEVLKIKTIIVLSTIIIVLLEILQTTIMLLKK